MVAKIVTYKTADDFKAVAQRIVSANGRNRTLMQEATIAAFEHMREHGDWTGSILPLLEASQSFGRNLATVYLNYVTAFTWLKYNPRDIALRDLNKKPFAERFAKDKERDIKSIDIDKAKAVEWFSFRKPATPAVDRPKKEIIAAFKASLARQVVSIQSQINDGKLTVAEATAIFEGAAKMLRQPEVKAGRVEATPTVTNAAKGRRGSRKAAARVAEQVKPETPAAAQAA